jgi:hypothetical protein
MALLAIASLFILATSAEAQNLVPNGSFEIRAQNPLLCPAAKSDFVGFVWRWISGNNLGTPDYFHQCAATCTQDVPDNAEGTEPAYHGIAYAGISHFDPMPGTGGLPYREYVLITFDNPLTIGTQYRVSFQASLAEVSMFGAGKLGLVLGQNLTPSGGSTPYPAFAQNVKLFYEHPTVINKTNGWEQVYTTFVAKGGENSIVIGCFEPILSIGNNVTDPWPCMPPNFERPHATYYYIDDVKLECTGPMCQTTTRFVQTGVDPETGNCCYDIFVKNTSDCGTVVDGFDIDYTNADGSTTGRQIVSYTPAGIWDATAPAPYRRSVSGPAGQQNVLASNVEQKIGSVCLAPNASAGKLKVTAKRGTGNCQIGITTIDCLPCSGAMCEATFRLVETGKNPETGDCCYDLFVTNPTECEPLIDGFDIEYINNDGSSTGRQIVSYTAAGIWAGSSTATNRRWISASSGQPTVLVKDVEQKIGSICMNPTSYAGKLKVSVKRGTTTCQIALETIDCEPCPITCYPLQTRVEAIPGTCCYEIYVENTSECDITSYGVVADLDNSNLYAEMTFTGANGWSGRYTNTVYNVKSVVAFENSTTNNRIPAGEEILVGTICVPSGQGQETLYVAPAYDFQNNGGYVHCSTGSTTVLVECDHDCCESLSMTLVTPATTAGGKCEWEIRITQDPSFDCIYGVNISGIGVVWDIGLGTSPIDFSNGVTVGRVSMNIPSGGGIASATISVQLLDQYENVMCTKTVDVTCSEPDPAHQ